MTIYSKEEFIEDLRKYIDSLSKWNDEKDNLEQVVNSSLEGFLNYLEDNSND